MKISQREAQRLRKQVAEFQRLEEQRRNAWSQDYPGVNIATLELADAHVAACCQTARRLDNAVCIQVEGRTIRFYAVKL